VWSASVAIIAINSKAINVPSFDIPYSYLIYPPVRHRSNSYSPRRRRCLIPYNAGYCECFLRFISPTSMQPISTTSPKSPHCLYSSLYIPSSPQSRLCYIYTSLMFRLTLSLVYVHTTAYAYLLPFIFLLLLWTRSRSLYLPLILTDIQFPSLAGLRVSCTHTIFFHSGFPPLLRVE